MSGKSRYQLDDSSDEDDEAAIGRKSNGKGKGKGKSTACKSSKRTSSSSSGVAGPPKLPNNNEGDPSSSDEDMDLEQSRIDPSIRENSKRFRREVRSKYRDVIEDLHANAKEYADEGNFQITRKLLEVDELYNSVTQTREAAMDSSTIAQIAQLGKQKARALKTDMFTFNAGEFADKLVVYSGCKRGEEIPEDKWKALGQIVGKHFKRAPSYACMLGTFERTEYIGKEKIARQRNQADKEDFIKNKTKVKELSEVEKTNEETTAKMTEHVYTLLKRFYKAYDEEPLDFFEFTVDPNSFGRTVENIFYLSFLVREGLAKVFLDDDKLPVLEPVDRKRDISGAVVAEAADTRLFNQVVVSFSHSQWREIVQVWGIDTALITKPQGLA